MADTAHMSGWKIKGRELTQEEWDARPKRIGTMLASGRPPLMRSPGCWPMRSDALGVNPSQIQEQMAADKEAGLSLEYDAHTGQCIIPSPSMLKKACIANGMHHNSAGYSDATPSDIPKDDTEMIDDSTAEDTWENPDE